MVAQLEHRFLNGADTMRIRLPAAAAAISILALAHGASAAEPVVAKLQAPVSGSTKWVAGGAVFECLGDVCAARSPSGDSAGLRGCKDLVRQVGPVAAFGPSSKQLSSDELASCNASAKH
jgi:hypothetical protein